MTIVCTRAILSFRYGEARRVLRICRTTAPFEEEGQFEEVKETPLPEIPGAAPLALPEKDTGLWSWFANGNRRAAWDLLCAAQQDREPVSSGKDARWALEMIHGVYASHLAGKRLALPLNQRRHPLE
jgi:hypothetical protein